MLAVNARVVTKKRFEWAVDSPAAVGAVADAMHLARAKLDGIQGVGASESYDALTVEARDDEIVVWFEREEN